jgi:hypothetical protein
MAKGASAEDELEARAQARAWGLPFLAMGEERGARALLVFSKEGIALTDDEGGTLRFTPGLAHLRCKRIDSGVIEDRLHRAADFKAGDWVLDCTLGLAQDAMVAARAVGPSGKVVALEKSLPLFAVVSSGLKHLRKDGRSCEVEPVRVDCLDYLSRLPKASFDLVLLDPMFRVPARAQPSFEMLRKYAEHAPLTSELLHQARRVARKRVVVKASRRSHELKGMGLRWQPGARRATFHYGIVEGYSAPLGGPSLPSGESFPESAPACSCGIKSLGER